MKYYNALEVAKVEATQHVILCEQGDSEKKGRKMAEMRGAVPGEHCVVSPFRAPVRVRDFTDYLKKLKDSDVSGIFYFADLEHAYEIHQKGSWEAKPLMPGEVGNDPGINWGTHWYCSKEEAEAFCKECDRDGFRHNEAEYHEELRTWSVHFHYFTD